MSKILRVKVRADFLQAARVGVCYRSKVLVLQSRMNGLGRLRVGFTATKKVGNAVVRNRCKRRMRAAADLVLREFGREGVDYIFIARRMLYSADWEKLLEVSRAAVIYLNRGLSKSEK